MALRVGRPDPKVKPIEPDRRLRAKIVNCRPTREQVAAMNEWCETPEEWAYVDALLVRAKCPGVDLLKIVEARHWIKLSSRRVDQLRSQYVG